MVEADFERVAWDKGDTEGIFDLFKEPEIGDLKARCGLGDGLIDGVVFEDIERLEKGLLFVLTQIVDGVEGYVPVLFDLLLAFFDRCEGLREGVIGGKLEAHGQGLDKETGDLGDIWDFGGATRESDAKGDVIGAGIAGQGERPGGLT